MSDASAPNIQRRSTGFAVREAARPAWAVLGERALEVLIYLCGISAIVFVLGIFFFVFKEAFPILGSAQFSLSQFLFSEQWYPTSEVNKRYGVLAMIAGTFSVTALAMLIAVPFGLGAAIYLSEFCGARAQGNAQGRHRTAGGHSQRGLGLHRPDGHEPAHREIHRRAGRRERPQRRHHPGADERADHRLDRRGRAQGRAGFLPRGGPGAGRDALAARLARAAAGRQERAAGRRAARRRAAASARPWPC